MDASDLPWEIRVCNRHSNDDGGGEEDPWFEFDGTVYDGYGTD